MTRQIRMYADVYAVSSFKLTVPLHVLQAVFLRMTLFMAVSSLFGENADDPATTHTLFPHAKLHIATVVRDSEGLASILRVSVWAVSIRRSASLRSAGARQGAAAGTPACR